MIKEIGILFLLLLVVVIFGNIWFNLIASILSKFRKIFTHRREPAAWHPLPADEEAEIKKEKEKQTGSR